MAMSYDKIEDGAKLVHCEYGKRAIGSPHPGIVAEVCKLGWDPPQPGQENGMSCYDLVVLSLFHGGLWTKKALENIYGAADIHQKTRVIVNTAIFDRGIWQRLLGGMAQTEITAIPHWQKGQLVTFWDGDVPDTTQDIAGWSCVPWHTGVCMEGNQVLHINYEGKKPMKLEGFSEAVRRVGQMANRALTTTVSDPPPEPSFG